MDHEYEWLFSEPQKKLNVNMINFKSAKKVFNANLNMVRNPFTIKELLKQILKVSIDYFFCSSSYTHAGF